VAKGTPKIRAYVVNERASASMCLPITSLFCPFIFLYQFILLAGVFYMTFGFIAVLVTSACLALLLLITMAT